MAVPDRAPPAALLAEAALFLDFDGTLVELAESPAAISVPSGLKPLLSRLVERLGGRVAIVSGRSITDIEEHLEIGRASCGERVCQYVTISVVAVSLKKKQKINIK